MYHFLLNNLEINFWKSKCQVCNNKFHEGFARSCVTIYWNLPTLQMDSNLARVLCNSEVEEGIFVTWFIRSSEKNISLREFFIISHLFKLLISHWSFAVTSLPCPQEVGGAYTVLRNSSLKHLCSMFFIYTNNDVLEISLTQKESS